MKHYDQILCFCLLVFALVFCFCFGMGSWAGIQGIEPLHGFVGRVLGCKSVLDILFDCFNRCCLALATMIVLAYEGTRWFRWLPLGLWRSPLHGRSGEFYRDDGIGLLGPSSPAYRGTSTENGNSFLRICETALC